MKKIIKLLLLSSVLMTYTTHAEEIIRLEDNSKILGKWKIYAETPALHKEKKEVNNDWHFKNNGMLSAISRDPRIDAPKEVSVKYSIEDGVIRKQFQPGREKYENCKVVKLEGKEMIIHCSYNYYLMRRL